MTDSPGHGAEPEHRRRDPRRRPRRRPRDALPLRRGALGWKYGVAVTFLKNISLCRVKNANVLVKFYERLSI